MFAVLCCGRIRIIAGIVEQLVHLLQGLGVVVEHLEIVYRCRGLGGLCYVQVMETDDRAAADDQNKGESADQRRTKMATRAEHEERANALDEAFWLLLLSGSETSMKAGIEEGRWLRRAPVIERREGRVERGKLSTTVYAVRNVRVDRRRDGGWIEKEIRKPVAAIFAFDIRVVHVKPLSGGTAISVCFASGARLGRFS